MRKLAHTALRVYGLHDARFDLVRQAGNTLYRVYSLPRARSEPPTGLFADGQFLLRLHWPGYQTADAIRLELEWLAAMRREKDLPVPEPVATLNGDLVTRVSIPGMPGERDCSLLRWVKGRRVADRARSRHYRAQGRLMARFHNFAQEWRCPPGLTKRRYDWKGLFEENPAACLPVTDVWSMLPRSSVEPFGAVARRVRAVMEAWGEGPRVYGLIHADLGVDANLLFWQEEPRAIDFDESGFGYWIYDLAIALEHCREDESFPRYRDALMDGYAEFRVLPDEQSRCLELFMAGVDVYLGLWANAAVRLRSTVSSVVRTRAERSRRLVAQYLGKG